MPRHARQSEAPWDALARIQRELAAVVKPLMTLNGAALLEPNSPRAAKRRAMLERLRAGHCISGLDALQRFGCERLAARIWDLRQAGIDIGRRLVMVRTRRGRARVAVYWLAAKSGNMRLS